MTPESNSTSSPKTNKSTNQIKSNLSYPNLPCFPVRGPGKATWQRFDSGVISLSNFLATIILARNVDPTQLGVYGVGFVTLRLVRAVQEGLIVQPNERVWRCHGSGMSSNPMLPAPA